jgi:hypothetical protein
VVSTAIWHAGTTPSLSRLAGGAGPAGVVIGREHAGDLAPLRLFRPEPTRVVVVGGSWVAHLLVFRCIANNAQVTVTTSSPARWNAFRQRVAAGDELLVEASGAAAPSATHAPTGQPALYVTDVGPAGAEQQHAWACHVTLLPTLTTTGLTAVADAQVVLVSRLSGPEAELLATSARLGPADATRLTQLHDDMFALVTAGSARYLWFATTSIEEEILGRPAPDELTA